MIKLKALLATVLLSSVAATSTATPKKHAVEKHLKASVAKKALPAESVAK